MKVVERDFTLDGKMKAMNKDQRREVQGFLPFFSVDTLEEAELVIQRAIAAGEFLVQADGSLLEATLRRDQTLENLNLAGERLKELLHASE